MQQQEHGRLSEVGLVSKDNSTSEQLPAQMMQEHEEGASHQISVADFTAKLRGFQLSSVLEKNIQLVIFHMTSLRSIKKCNPGVI
ncbi:hypothetical protein BDD43_0597 [Mucilaginibacter gracilis]|uniref:Uncharacterized protein n=1 Tax=Mucilaginibacter gracilis TaxID=423350 RepID=A0A495IVX8_9SPHI|nr:hypothetical protein [Mucilaginibacter gracilis]RKR80481.1 hypothetical protein BDD43_0597 [Mucilaginibacter gracilis]